MAFGPNAELVRRALLAQNRAADDEFAAALAPDIVWHAGTNEFGLPQLLHGPEEVVAAARDARERAGGLTATLHEVREDAGGSGVRCGEQHQHERDLQRHLQLAEGAGSDLGAAAAGGA